MTTGALFPAGPTPSGRTNLGPSKTPSREAHAGPFDYTAHLDAVIEHVVAHCPALAYVQTDRLVTSWSQSKVGGTHGVFATIHPLRFEGGAQAMTRGRHTYRWPPVLFDQREILYFVFFMLPRFADMPFRGKLTTIFHELYHVNPLCNGDLRRFPGRNYAHGRSREEYNARLQPWIDRYLEVPGSQEVTAFLQLDFAALQAAHRSVSGRRLQPVRPVRIAAP